ncbi:hypothetical protein [Shimia sp.]|uniref:hypothetical protein n=1 Tax=Shimia sp. TaxID=1954381 RepID=UPI0032993D85
MKPVAQSEFSAEPPFVDLRPDESVLATWRPQLRYFLYKAAFVSGLTALCLGSWAEFSFQTAGVLIWLASLVVSALFYAFIFDDFQEWPARRDDVWVLTSQRLVYFNPYEQEFPTDMPLDHILKVQVWMFWGVRVRLIPRDQIMMQFLPDRAGVKVAIKDALANLKSSPQPQGPV